jgi:peptide chain release factor subunit 1
MSSPSFDRRERVAAVADASAGGDVLVTVAVPPDQPVGEALERAEEERAEADYLDEGSSSKPLRRALERVVHVLHGYDRTPENGLVVYAGVVDGDLQEHVFDDLPAPVRESAFAVGNAFDTEPLESAARPTRTYGLLVVERGGAALGRLVGERVEPVETIDSDVMGKTKAGGQSADRFERDRERQKHEFFQEVADEAERALLGDGAGDSGEADGDETTADDGHDEDDATVDGLVLGGTTVTVDEFRDGDYLDYRLADRVVGTFPVEYASEQGLRQLADRAQETVADDETRREREALDRFLDGVTGDEVVYGRDATLDALDYGAVETTLVSAALDADDRRDLAARTDDEGGDLVVVGDGFERGRRFREAFGGVGALLRFPVE